MQRTTRMFLLVAGGLLALVVLLTLLAWTFVDSEWFRHCIERTVSRAAGMELKIDGPVRIGLLPAPGLRMEDLHLRNGNAEWISASGVVLQIRIRPLLRGRVEVDSVDLLEPNLQLKRDSDGAYNFIPADRPDDAWDWGPLGIRHFRVRDAALTFTDQASGKWIAAESCDWMGQNLAWRPAQSPSEWNPPDFQGHLNCRKVTYDALEVTELQARVSVQDQRIEVGAVTGRLFDGRLRAELESELSGPSPVHALELELADFRVERYIETFQEEKGAEGLLTFTAKLNFSGGKPAEMVASLAGQTELSGTGLVLHGWDLDEQLARYESTQRFNLVDTAAFFLAGPVGLVVTRGYGFASLFRADDEQTTIQELVSRWAVENGTARARDVALSTAENRLALAGGLNFVTLRFEDLRVAVIDTKGCAVVEQRVQGEFRDPMIAQPNFLVTLAGPLIDIVKRGIGLFTESDCDPFYTGRVEQP
jgi:AsmA protein